jgi:predicted AlkP superfamily phosphohydrolase/phosphomutase
MNKTTKVAVLGLDGVPYGLLKEFLESGVMPRLAERTAGGSLRMMASTIPPISSTAWSSFMTGEEPGRHGIFGFTDLVPGEMTLRLPSFDDILCPTIWRDLPTKRTIVVNLPFTYPARPLNGTLISGFVAPLFDRAVYPESLIPRLKSTGYRIDVDAARGRTEPKGLIEDLFSTLNVRFEVMLNLVRTQPWDLFIGVVTGTDRLHHFFFDAAFDGSHAFHDDFIAYYRRADALMGELFDGLGSETRLIVLSDHGFTRLKTQVYVNAILNRLGYLEFTTSAPEGPEHVSPRSQAFALEPGRIYINSRSRFRTGILGPAAEEEVLYRLKHDLEALRPRDLDGPMTTSSEPPDTRLFDKVLTRDEAFGTDCVPAAPDLVPIPREGYDLKAAFDVRTPFMRDIFTGTHTHCDAFLLVDDPSIAANLADPKISDVAGCIKRCLP